jgi:hypothetical protein
MIHGIPMSNKTLKDLKVDAHIAVLHTKVDSLIEKQKELTVRVRANEKVVAAIGLLGSIALAFIGAGYFAPKAEACSPRLDGEPTYCPPWDDVILEKPVAVSIPEEEENPYTHTVTLFDTRVAHMGHDFPTWPTAGEMIQAIREEEAKKNRNSIDDMLNSALEDMEIDYGKDDPTEQKELLQLQSGIDRQSFRW